MGGGWGGTLRVARGWGGAFVLHSEGHQQRQEREAHGGEGPVHAELREQRRPVLVDLPGDRRPGALHPFVEATVPAERAGIVGQRADEPVDQALEGGVQEAVAEIEEEGPRVSRAGVLEVELLFPLSVGVPQLVGQAAAPRGGAQRRHRSNAQEAPAAAAAAAVVEHPADARRTRHLRPPVENVVQAGGAQVEEQPVDVVELVGVEEVAGPRCRRDQQHPPVAEQLGDLHGLGGHVGVPDGGGAAAVPADDAAGGEHGEGEQCPRGHEAHEGDVGAVVDRGGGRAAVVEDEGDETADDAPHVEDAPEDGDVRALAAGRRVRGHDGALACPEEASPDAEHRPGDDGEGLLVAVVVVQE